MGNGSLFDWQLSLSITSLSSSYRLSTPSFPSLACGLAEGPHVVTVEQAHKLVTVHLQYTNFNNEPLRIIMGCISSGLRHTDGFIISTLQKHLFREMKLADTGVKSPEVLKWNSLNKRCAPRESSNEGYSWTQIYPEHRFLAFYHHKYSDNRAYLITDTEIFFYTTDSGRTWNRAKTPTPPNTFGAQVIYFHRNTDNLIWTGNRGCSAQAQSCHAEAQYSRDNGRKWSLIDSYVRTCAWAKDAELNTDPNEIIGVLSGQEGQPAFISE